ncbi:MAG: DUF86 domain-containing protein [Caulobacteraceae bacterium]|nr:DUF86 domain-containing protein [Caulobacteraceae bacterium]
MPSERSAQAWGDIAVNARLALRWTDDLTAATFADDTRTVYAVTRALEIVSEAARRLEASERTARPELPWKDITGAGNVYRHDYDEVSPEIVWLTVKRRLPEILAAAEAALAS